MTRQPYKRRIRNLLIDRRFQLKYTLIIVLMSGAIFAALGWMYLNERQRSSQLKALYYQEKVSSNELMEIQSIVKRSIATDKDPGAALGPEGDPGAAPPMGGFDDILKEMEARERKEVQENLQVAPPEQMTRDSAALVAARLQARDEQWVYLLIGAVGALVLLLALAGIYITHKVAGPVYALTLFFRALKNGEWNRIRQFRKGDEFRYLSDEFQDLTKAVRSRHESELVALDQVRGCLEGGQVEDAKAGLAAVTAEKKGYLSAGE